MIENKTLTSIFMYSGAITSLLFWVYTFGALALGYSFVSWKEPNPIIRLMEFFMTFIILIYFLGELKHKMLKFLEFQHPKFRRTLAMEDEKKWD